MVSAPGQPRNIKAKVLPHNRIENHYLTKKLYRGYFLTNFAEIFAHKGKMF
jgi:hypothetical protein